MAKRRVSLQKITPSIITSDMEHCYICKKYGAELHHCMFGTGYRKLSDKYGLIVPLCYEHHQGDNGVHGKNGAELNLKLKQIAQEKFEFFYGHENWMHTFGRNFL